MTAKRHTRRQRHSYSPKVVDLIWDRLLDDVSLRQICQDPNVPARSTLFVWLRRHPEFACPPAAERMRASRKRRREGTHYVRVQLEQIPFEFSHNPRA